MEERNPSISKEEFERLGFKQLWYTPNEKDGGTWSVKYLKHLNPSYYYDVLEIQWFHGTNRYEIWRQTKSIGNIPCFQGFMNSVKDLEYLLTLFDYHKFYDRDNRPA